MLFAQLSIAQTVSALYLRQPPLPSHLPSVSQDEALLSWQTLRGSAVPAGIDVHLPIDDGSAQLRQAPLHASLQQTPSTQKAERHSDARVQVCPFCLGPQLWFTHARPGLQSVSASQRVLQAPLAHP
jgi:hypothetical protein